MIAKIFHSKKLIHIPLKTYFNVKSHFEPYIKLGRYDKPIGTLLLFLPCTWGIALGLPSLDTFESLRLIGLFGFGSVMLRSAGCAINDLWDIEFDKKVERTKSRPLASGSLTPRQAFSFIALHLSGGLFVLSQLNLNTVILSFGIVPIAFLYPLAKRISNHPQLVLGMAFNWGMVSGFCASTGAVFANVVMPAYIAGIAWTLIYDTIYAHQDKEDDIKIGVKSTALTWGEKTKRNMRILNWICTSGFFLTGLNAGMMGVYYPLIGLSHFYMGSLIDKVDLNDRQSCNETFNNNKLYGLLILFSIVLGKRKEGENGDKMRKEGEEQEGEEQMRTMEGGNRREEKVMTEGRGIVKNNV